MSFNKVTIVLLFTIIIGLITNVEGPTENKRLVEGLERAFFDELYAKLRETMNKAKQLIEATQNKVNAINNPEILETGFYNNWKDTHTAKWPELNHMTEVDRFKVCVNYEKKSFNRSVVVQGNIPNVEVTSVFVTFRNNMYVSEGVKDENPAIDTQVIFCPMKQADYHANAEGEEVIKFNYYLGKWNFRTDCYVLIVEEENMNRNHQTGGNNNEIKEFHLADSECL